MLPRRRNMIKPFIQRSADYFYNEACKTDVYFKISLLTHWNFKVKVIAEFKEYVSVSGHFDGNFGKNIQQIWNKYVYKYISLLFETVFWCKIYHEIFNYGHIFLRQYYLFAINVYQATQKVILHCMNDISNRNISITMIVYHI